MSKRREPLLVNGVLLNAGTGAEASCVIALEEHCPSCGGSGESDSEAISRYKGCNYCEGAGVVITDQGRAILQLVIHHLKSVDSDTLIAKKNI